jgi:intracellular septation protein
MKNLVKPIIEFGPVAIFFYFFIKTGEIQSAILPLMIAAGVAIVASYLLEKKVNQMLLFSTILIFVFGSLTIYFNDPFFIKIKVTIVNLLFAIILYGGLLFKKLFLKSLMGGSLKMDNESWFILSKRWALFFLFLAVCNEVVYRNFSDAFWVNFKLFGIMGLTFVFIFSQVFFIQKNIQE